DAVVVVYLGDRAHGRALVVAGALLLDGDRGGESLDRVHIGLLHQSEELTGIRGQRLDVATLPLGVNRVEGQGGLAGSGQPGDHGEDVELGRDGDVLGVVLGGGADDQRITGHRLVG